MRPTLAAGNGDLWLMSTPNGQRGFFHQEWTEGGSQWVRIRVTGPECPRIDPSFLADERTSGGDKWFRQEYLCEFVERDGAVFPQDAIYDALQEYETPEL